MIFTKIFNHFKIPLENEPLIKPKHTDIINLNTLKRMKIVKGDGQWVCNTQGFDDASGPTTWPFTEEEVELDAGDNGGDENVGGEGPSSPRRRRMPSTSQSAPPPGRSMSEDQFNILQGRIDSLTTTMDDRMIALERRMDQMSLAQEDFFAHMYSIYPRAPPPPPEE